MEKFQSFEDVYPGKYMENEHGTKNGGLEDESPFQLGDV